MTARTYDAFRLSGNPRITRFTPSRIARSMVSGTAVPPAVTG